MFKSCKNFRVTIDGGEVGGEGRVVVGVQGLISESTGLHTSSYRFRSGVGVRHVMRK